MPLEGNETLADERVVSVSRERVVGEQQQTVVMLAAIDTTLMAAHEVGTLSLTTARRVAAWSSRRQSSIPRRCPRFEDSCLAPSVQTGEDVDDLGHVGSMLISGDVVHADLGERVGREAGYPRPVVVVTAQVVLAQGAVVVHVVPLTSTRRGVRSEVDVEPDEANGLDSPSSAQCQHLRAVSIGRLSDPIGHVGSTTLVQIRETMADLLDL